MTLGTVHGGELLRRPPESSSERFTPRVRWQNALAVLLLRVNVDADSEFAATIPNRRTATSLVALPLTYGPRASGADPGAVRSRSWGDSDA